MDSIHFNLIYDADNPEKRFYRRRHPELVPVPVPGRDFVARDFAIGSTTRLNKAAPSAGTPSVRGSPSNGSCYLMPPRNGPKRAVSLTRLDQLAQPKLRYREESLKARTSGNAASAGNGSSTPVADCMVKSMIELPSKTPLYHGARSLSKGMSSSMTHLNRMSPTRKQRYGPSKASADDMSTAVAYDLDVPLSRSNQGQMSNKQQILPRDSKSSRLRNVQYHKAGRLPLNLDDGMSQSKEGILSPNRPNSSMSLSSSEKSNVASPNVAMRPRVPARRPRPTSMMASIPYDKHKRTPELNSPSGSNSIKNINESEQSTTPKVSMRPRVARKPRPISVGTFVSDRRTDGAEPQQQQQPQRMRQSVKQQSDTPATTARRPGRALSAGASSRHHQETVGSANEDVDRSGGGAQSPLKPQLPRKPAHVKAAAAARKAIKQEGTSPTSTAVAVVAPNIKEEVNGETAAAVATVVAHEEEEVESKALDNKSIENATASPLIVFEAEQELVTNIVCNGDSGSDVASVAIADKQQLQQKENNNEPVVEVPIENLPVAATAASSAPSAAANAVNIAVAPAAATTTTDETSPNDENVSPKKEISEEEYKRIMAEKRRLAREQAEREAEQERLRQEQLLREEEERIMREEEEMRRFEEEHVRLIEEHRRAEEEKLRLAIEEQTKRDDEARKARDEETRLRLEREEQEARAREEAEKARLELEEMLRKDEEERLARKKRVEAIMSRTRKTPAKGGSPTHNLKDSQTPEPELADLLL